MKDSVGVPTKVTLSLPEPVITKYRCCLCSCLWRRNPDRSWSLYDSDQKSCKVCDNSPDFFAVIDPVVSADYTKRVKFLEDCISETIKRYPGSPGMVFLASVTAKTVQPNSDDLEWAKQKIAELCDSRDSREGGKVSDRWDWLRDELRASEPDGKDPSHNVSDDDVRYLLADRDGLAERCEKLREALQELHNRLSRRDVFVATCEGVTYKGWLLNIVNAALAEKEGE